MLNFSQKLQAWSDAHPRNMPWKGEKDPYKIWLSEIILQQTRVEQGWAYYERFIQHYPTVQHLADAPEAAVLKDWEGLGYYSRARNLHATARHIANALGGAFPDTYEGILALKGVGPYTAAAIASFAYNLPYPVLDGNVYRILSRLFGIEMPIDTPAARRIFEQKAADLLDRTQPGLHNQAMMDFGATHCLPVRPLCDTCPFHADCMAVHTGRVSELPVKSKNIVKKERFFLYIVLKQGEQTWIQQRTTQDIWQQLYEFPLIELSALPATRAEATEYLHRHWPEWAAVATQFELKGGSKTCRQTLTHRYVNAVFLTLEAPTDISVNIFKNSVFLHVNPVLWEDFKQNYPKPLIINLFLSDTLPTFAF
jgi:A/G-specific adenine glycosylase